MWGTFANIRLRNLMVEEPGPYTIHHPGGERLEIYEAAMKYVGQGVPTIILAGKEYGSGSSRDWAAKGPALLGVRAVIAESFERIHRSNLIGMGILPLEFLPGQNARALDLKGNETYDIQGISQGLHPKKKIAVRAARPDGESFAFEAVARLDSPGEVEYYANGGILPTVLRQMIQKGG